MSKVFKQTESQVKYQKKFIDKARKVHDNKYDYSKVEYVNARTKICIICPIHGEFWQIPYIHSQNHGCPICGIEITKNKISITQKQFEDKANKTHNNKFKGFYGKYKSCFEKITIWCPKCNIYFNQTPASHLSGTGCPKCAGVKKSTTKEFIEKARKVHPDKDYDYSNVEYVNSKIKVKIICRKHGEFLQTPSDHLHGYGCPICGIENSNYITGQYHPKYPEKYSGEFDPIYRSSYELKAFQMIEEDENILKWESETIRIPYKFNGKLYNYVVDLQLKTKNGIYLIEIKPESKTRPSKYDYHNNEYHKNMKKWEAAKEYCKERNWIFRIWTERELGI